MQLLEEKTTKANLNFMQLLEELCSYLKKNNKKNLKQLFPVHRRKSYIETD